MAAVYDGDTIKVRFLDGTEKRLRFIGVDAPEVEDPREHIAYQGHLAKRFVSFHLSGNKIELTYDEVRTDKYGRTLAYVWTEKQGLFNEFIIREGFGRAMLAFPFREDYRRRFRDGQREAKSLKKGLWQEDDPEEIPAKMARSHLGRILSVKFFCAEVAQKRSFVCLVAPDETFEAAISRDRLCLFPSPQEYLHKAVIATGFLEEFRGRPQVIISFRRQLRLIQTLELP